MDPATVQGLVTLRALGFAISAGLCAMMAVLQWRSSRLAGGARIHVVFWICGLVWTVPNLLVMALILAGTPRDARVLDAAVAIGWSSTSLGPLIGASAMGAHKRLLVPLAALASAVMFVLTLAVGLGMAFPLPIEEVALVSLAGTVLFALAAGGARRLVRGLASRSTRSVLTIAVVLALAELGTLFTTDIFGRGLTARVVGIVVGEQWPIPWAVLVAAVVARTHYVDVVLKRSLALIASIAAVAAILWPILGPGLPLVLASLVAAALVLAAPALRQALSWIVDRLILRRPDYLALAAAFAEEARRAPDADALLDLAQTRIGEALRLEADFAAAPDPGPGAVRKAVAGALGPPLTLTATPANPNRTLLQNEHAFLDAVALETAHRLEALALEAERREREGREARLTHAAAQAELKALRSQVDSHFLFNTLNAIAALVATEPEKAEAMTERLADIFRYTLSRQDNAFSTLDEELAFIAQYLAIEQVRFGERLQVDLAAEPGLGGWTVPSLILQPLVENAVRHGLSPKREGGKITVSATRAGDRLQLRVADDGVGMARTAARRQGIGLSNVRARLQALYGAASRMDIAAGADGRGTDVALLLPAHGG